MSLLQSQHFERSHGVASDAERPVVDQGKGYLYSITGCSAVWSQLPWSSRGQSIGQLGQRPPPQTQTRTVCGFVLRAARLHQKMHCHLITMMFQEESHKNISLTAFYKGGVLQSTGPPELLHSLINHS